jgi:uncharacterized protein involved in type VI secretion and phage assembly
MALKQNPKERFLRIETVLKDSADEDVDDNFVLIQARGVEGISVPYAFDLAVIGPRKNRPDPAKLIGSRARFGIKHVTNEGDDDVFEFVMRHGIIETFEDTGPLDEFRSYAMRLVPAFKLTAYETRYRVFEDRTLEQVLQEVLSPYHEIQFSTAQMKEEAAEKIPYCVQFGESTFNFVHRLLERHGCFYRFEHEDNEQREVMVIGGVGAVPPVQVEVVHVDGGDPGRGRVTGFRRSAVLATRKARVGNFNEINPATPFRGEAEIAPAYDLADEFPPHEAEAFPVPARVAPEPRNYAQRRMRQNEAGVFLASGNTRSAKFRAGRKFVVTKDLTIDEDEEPDKGQAGRTFLLRTCAIFAFDHSALVDLGDRILDVIGGVLGIGGGKDAVATAAAKALLEQVKTNIDKGGKIIDWIDGKPGAENPSGLPDFLSSALGTGGSALAGAVPLLISTVKSVKELVEALTKETDGISVAFDALPFDPPHLRDLLPMPGCSKPVANGPHLALVVGPDGIDAAQRDIHVDALGRVRIRFPWDPGPDHPKDPIGKGPLETGRNTCFVRVAEGWAGERMGTQFLPRIGQEVLVGFIDGDPERPMVVGRAYNARGGTAHLPYLPASAVGRQISVPDDLRATETDQATRSGIRTKTTPKKPEGQSGFHMMRLDDKQGEEQFLLRSERRMDITAFGNRYDSTRGNLHVLVGGGQEPGKPPPGGSIFITAGGEYDLHVGQDQFEEIGSAINITVKADKIQDVGAGWFTYATGTAVLDAEEIVLNAKKKITLKVGGSTVVVTPAAIDNDAPFYREQMGGSPGDAGPVELTAPADAAMADPGDPPDWLAKQPKGKGGGRRKHTKHPNGAPFLSWASDGTLQVGGGANGAESGLRIKTDDPDFANKVAEDLDKINQTEAGNKKIVDAIHSETPTVIEQPPPTDPPVTGVKPNHWPAAVPEGQPTGRTNPDGTPEMGTGQGTGSTIYYDPSAWPREGDPNSPTSAEQLDKALTMSDQMRNGQVPPGSQGQSYTPPGGGSPPPGGGGGGGGAPADGSKWNPTEGGSKW